MIAGRAVTLLDGGLEWMVFTAAFVAIAALVSKTTDACSLIAAPVVNPDLGSTVYWT